MPEKSLISVVLATYNWPQALRFCLQCLSEQTDKNFEVVIADDGSTDETAQLIKSCSQSLDIKIKHVWQQDVGFRKAMILNKAMAESAGEYLVFLDGDCLAQPDFIERHRKLSQSGVMVTGSRVLLGKILTEQLCESGYWSYKNFVSNAFSYRLTGELNKIFPLIFKVPDNSMRLYKNFVWRRIKGCNMAAWREDALKIQGFDENLQGWGHEDADFVFRLQQAGIRRKSGAWATEVLHLWHLSASQENATKNAEIVRAKILAKDHLHGDKFLSLQK